MLFNAGVLATGYALGFLELATCTVALATGTYFLIEKPALAIKHRWAAARQPAQPSPATVPARAAAL